MTEVLEETAQGAARTASLLLEAEQPVQSQEGEACQGGQVAGQGGRCWLDEGYVQMLQACITRHFAFINCKDQD